MDSKEKQNELIKASKEEIPEIKDFIGDEK